MTDTRRWRVGTHYGIHGYAENADKFDDEDEPIFTAHTRAIAEQIVFDHNALHLHLANDGRPADIEVGGLLHEIAKLKRKAERLERRNEDLQERGLRLAGQLLRANGELHEFRVRLVQLAGGDASQMPRMLEATTAEDYGVDGADCA